eukprot:CAMPEP_0181304420 /NCGR_PEP_ID=MMETSP1101-20121128/9141_1 /TAXON_ID=46948 /ORGANISM="Rhodomonas abbreviata, Strain Caron Lab Isolate" /LENGTH=356 /DNA_ID=CAMNT_0023410177 /DNA_START=163 /DNA_END=1233 /DNA_ORIENTATION=-
MNSQVPWLAGMCGGRASQVPSDQDIGTARSEARSVSTTIRNEDSASEELGTSPGWISMSSRGGAPRGREREVTGMFGGFQNLLTGWMPGLLRKEAEAIERSIDERGDEIDRTSVADETNSRTLNEDTNAEPADETVDETNSRTDSRTASVRDSKAMSRSNSRTVDETNSRTDSRTASVRDSKARSRSNSRDSYFSLGNEATRTVDITAADEERTDDRSQFNRMAILEEDEERESEKEEDVQDTRDEFRRTRSTVDARLRDRPRSALQKLPKTAEESYVELREQLWGVNVEPDACKHARVAWQLKFEAALDDLEAKEQARCRLCSAMVCNFMLIPSLCALGFLLHISIAIFVYPLSE